jgi:TRAP-type C4-dicarboxylate transport system permease small subunit
MVAVHSLARGLNRLAGGILFFMMILTLLDVLLRKFWSQGILGGFELSEFMLSGVVFCALAQAEIDDRHIHVDLIASLKQARLEKPLTALVQFLSALMMGAIASSCFLYAISVHAAGEVSLDLGIPRYPLMLLATLGCALLVLVMLIRCCMTLTAMRRS